jgi:hypothetical protein
MSESLVVYRTRTRNHFAAKYAEVYRLRRTGLTYAAIGREVGLSPERIRQIVVSEQRKAKHDALLGEGPGDTVPMKTVRADFYQDLVEEANYNTHVERELRARIDDLENQLRAAQMIVDYVVSAGFKPIFASRLRVDFDKFLDALGPTQEAELFNIIAKRKEQK